MAHPILLLSDIGITLSEKARKELIELEPHLSNSSPTPYEVLEKTSRKQKIQYNFEGLLRWEEQSIIINETLPEFSRKMKKSPVLHYEVIRVKGGRN